jgi:phosphoserine phosphatase
MSVSKERIDELNRELYTLKCEQGRQNRESLQWAEKRDILHEEIKKLRMEAKNLKEKRDALNDEVRHLKTLREEIKRKYNEEIGNIQRLKQQIRETKTKLHQKNVQSLEKEIERFEWRIQTDSLSLNEEKKLVEQVKNLEKQLEFYGNMESKKDEIQTLENAVKKHKFEILAYQEKIVELAALSQKSHLKMLEYYEKMKELKAEADKMHKKYLESREKAQVFQSRYKEVLNQILSIKRAVQEREEKERIKKLAELKALLEKNALEKLKRGDKLTFEEFKILAEQGKI